MSRAYRISVRETLRRVLRAHDRVSTQLELLEILSPEEMAELLSQELEKRGFERKDGNLSREEDGVTVSVDPKTGTVTVAAESSEEVDLQQAREGTAWDDAGPSAKNVREGLRKQAQTDLERQADKKTSELQSQVTDRLEKQLGDLRQELDQAVNRVTAEALKEKARRMGQIKEITEDEQTGSLTIVVEV
jgi:FtsH ternary system domain X5